MKDLEGNTTIDLVFVLSVILIPITAMAFSIGLGTWAFVLFDQSFSSLSLHNDVASATHYVRTSFITNFSGSERLPVIFEVVIP